jgi:hypothetical protein
MAPPLINVAGYCTATSARILVVGNAPGVARLAFRAGNGAIAPTAGQPRAPAQLLAGPTSTFGLFPLDRPLRGARLGCNGIESAPEPTRFARGLLLKQQIDAGHIDLLIHAGDQIHADHFVNSIRQKPDLRNLGPGNVAAVEPRTIRRWGWGRFAADSFAFATHDRDVGFLVLDGRSQRR